MRLDPQYDEVIAMAAVHSTLLALLVARDERTQEEIVAGFEQCARQHGEDAALSLRTFRRWLVGDVRTQPRPAQRRVARLYWGLTMPQLLGPPPPELPSAAVADLAVSLGRADLMWQADLPGHPATNDTSLDLERQVAMSTRRAARFTAFAEAQNLGAETLEQIRDELRDLANAYLHEPINTLMGDLVATQDLVFKLLEGRQKPAHTRDLYLFAGVVTSLIAKVSHDLGRPHEAMTQTRTVFVCADNADHPGMRAWARGLQSLIAYWAGRPQEAVRYAQAGNELAAHVTGSTAAWLPALEARAWAQLARSDEADQAVMRALAARDQIQPDDLDHIGGLFTFSQAKQHYYAAGTYVFLDGDEAQAQREATTAIDLYEQGPAHDRSFSDEAGSRAELALARVHEGELEGARDALDPVLELEPELRIGGIVASAFRVHEALRAKPYVASPVARDLREQIESFCRLPVAALPQ